MEAEEPVTETVESIVEEKPTKRIIELTPTDILSIQYQILYRIIKEWGVWSSPSDWDSRSMVVFANESEVDVSVFLYLRDGRLKAEANEQIGINFVVRHCSIL